MKQSTRQRFQIVAAAGYERVYLFGSTTPQGWVVANRGNQVPALQDAEMAAQVGSGHAEGQGKLAGAGAAALIQITQNMLPCLLHPTIIYANKYLRINNN